VNALQVEKSRLRLLHVEDNPDDQEIIRRCLTNNLPFGFVLVGASRGQEALEELKREQYDMVLVDYQLPDMTGLEFIRHLGSEKMPVASVFITGMGDVKVAVEAMKEGARNYIVKDQIQANPGQLVQTIRDYVLESTFPAGLDREELSTVFEMFAKGGGIEIRQEARLSSSPGGPKDTVRLFSFLESLRGTELVLSNPIRSIVACPSCKSVEHSPLLLCPDCGSPSLEKGDAMQHLACRHTEFVKLYQRDGDGYLCPSCKKRVGKTPNDHRVLPRWYRCRRGHVFEIPKQWFACLQCKQRFNLYSCELQTLSTYKLSAEGEQKLRLSSSMNSKA